MQMADSIIGEIFDAKHDPREHPCACGLGVYFNTHTHHNHCPACGDGECDPMGFYRAPLPLAEQLTLTLAPPAFV